MSQTFEFSTPIGATTLQHPKFAENLQILPNSEKTNFNEELHIEAKRNPIPIPVFTPNVIVNKDLSRAEIERRPIIFFDITVDNKPAGTIFIELFNETVPKTAENFRVLATGRILLIKVDSFKIKEF